MGAFEGLLFVRFDYLNLFVNIFMCCCMLQGSRMATKSEELSIINFLYGMEVFQSRKLT